MKINCFKTIAIFYCLVALLQSCQWPQKSKNILIEKSEIVDIVKYPKFKKTLGTNEFQFIVCGIQDRKGNLWFGTFGQGVYCYDGKAFTQYTIKNGLNNNAVYSILEDNKGNIWFGTSDGICKYDGKNFTAININFYLRTQNINENYYNDWSTKNTVWSIYQDEKGILWFGLGDGVYYYDNGVFNRFLSDPKIINRDSLKLGMVNKIIKDKNGNMWFASGMQPGYEGLCCFDGKQIISYKPNGERWIRNIIQRKNGDLLIVTRHLGVLIYNGKSFDKFTNFNEKYKSELNTIYEDSNENLWFAYDYGKDIGDTLGGAWFCDISKSNNLPKKYNKICKYATFFFLEDASKNIWIGTRDLGLYRYNGHELISYSE